MYFISFTVKGMGLTNQLFALGNGIDKAIKNKCNVVVIDKFLCDYNKDYYVNISSVLDLEKMNIYFKEKYNLILVDKYNFDFELFNVTYGTEDNNLNITDTVKEKYYSNKKLFIDKHTNINDIQGDPCPNVRKHIWIKYKLNNNMIIDKYMELNQYLTENIDYTNDNYILVDMAWPSEKYNTFIDILLNITFNKKFLDISQRLLSDINLTKKVNLVHLRIEDDGINHWSRMNGMSKDFFKMTLEKKYIKLIEEYIDKNDTTILLSSSFDNEVINFLNENQYKYFTTIKKHFEYRELNGIVDFITSQQCNNVFIGNFNLHGNNGSTFSYYIYKSLEANNITYKYIDLDRL